MWIQRYLPWSCSRCWEDAIATGWAIEIIDWHILMFRTVFILHLPQNSRWGLGSIGWLVIMLNIHSLIPLSKRWQLLESSKNMCRKEKHTQRWSHFSIIFWQLLSSWLHSEKYVSLPLTLFPFPSSNHIIYMIEHAMYTAITWDNETVLVFDIHRVQYRNGLNTSITFFKMEHSSGVRKSGR